MAGSLKESFYSLTADRILDIVEPALALSRPGLRLSGRALALNSLENRVYELELEDNTSVVTKFYRPHRWSENQIVEEHQFLSLLEAHEIPVVFPMKLKPHAEGLETQASSLLQSRDGIFFTVFPKVRGRLIDELQDSHLQTLGRYLARLHGLGRSRPFKYRTTMNVKDWGWKPLDEILKSSFIDSGMAARYKEVVSELLKSCENRLKSAALQVVHGDCHLGNTLWNGESPFFLDFDDAMMAPKVQDIWMVIRGRDEEALRQREVMLRTYETMQDFDYSELSLIEPLRALRIIHYSAWIVRRYDDPCFPQAFPNFGSPGYWRDEIEALSEIHRLMNGGSARGFDDE